MKFELVEFYPIKNPKFKKTIGTIHIYAIDCQLDIRGIFVIKSGNSMFFNFPHFRGVDDETGQEVNYPLIRWTNAATQKEMMEFLHQEVRPIILERLKPKFK